MEEGQHAERHIARREVEQVVDRPHVRADIFLGEHNTFGIACGARGENDRERIIRPNPLEAKRRLEHAKRHEPGLHEANSLVEPGRLLPECPRIEQPGTEIEFHAGQEGRA